jgi:hypothetical protein
MQIDKDKQGRPHAMLVSVSPAPSPDPAGKYFTIFIPIDQIIKLRHVDQILVGHPLLDIPAEEIIGIRISKADHNNIMRYLDRGRFVAIRAVGKRGKRSRGCYLDNQGQPLVQYRFSWRRQETYITDPIDLIWLKEFSKQSERFVDQVFLIEAIMGYFRRLGDKLTQAPKPKKIKKKRMKAKDRRALKLPK